MTEEEFNRQLRKHNPKVLGYDEDQDDPPKDRRVLVGGNIDEGDQGFIRNGVAKRTKLWYFTRPGQPVRRCQGGPEEGRDRP